ncbi:DUF4238 domain-containing protein [Microbacterium enclense]|uniref:DUF4238 domain-containing protein n=1 Tax=Microbacterium enclense TaxID=993073 RepID=A0A3S3LDJ5_9MICO|nr:DUF4238 domain-containing protein [Microbacterium enclense]RWR18234.1 DUF4238 domain-containing protein [Microbacterium enclense]
MGTSRPPRRHHVVPRFYLEGFAKARLLRVVDLPGDNRFTQSVTSATVENDYYTVESHPEGGDVFERALGRIEAEASQVFRQVTQENMWPLHPVDRETLATFITLQLLRGPAQREQLKQTALAVARLIISASGPHGLQRLAAAHGEDLSAAEAKKTWEQLSADGALDVTISAATHIGHLGYLLPRLLKYIHGRPWALVRFERRGLITSDAPVYMIPDPKMPPHMRMGLQTARGLAFPVDRRHALLLSSPEPFIRGGVSVEEVMTGAWDLARPGTTKDERAVNLSTALNARKRLYHHPDDEQYVPSILPEPVDSHLSAEDIYAQHGEDYPGDPEDWPDS